MHSTPFSADDMVVSVSVPVDFLILSPKTDKLKDLPSKFGRAIARNLRAAQDILTNAEVGQSELYVWQFLHAEIFLSWEI